MVLYIANARAVASCDTLVDAVDGGATTNPEGRMLLYDGAVPTSADEALGAQSLVATIPFNNPSFGAAVDAAPGATATMDNAPVPEDASATGSLNPVTFFRIVDRSGTTVVMQGSVGTSGADLNLNTTTISNGASVQLTSMTVTVPES